MSSGTYHIWAGADTGVQRVNVVVEVLGIVADAKGMEPQAASGEVKAQR